MRNRTPQQQTVIKMMLQAEREGYPTDGIEDRTMKALRDRGDVVSEPKPGSALSLRWTLTEQGRGGPAPVPTLRAEKVAEHLTEAMVNGLFYPNGHHEPRTMQALRERGLIASGAVTDLGREVRQVLTVRGVQ